MKGCGKPLFVSIRRLHTSRIQRAAPVPFLTGLGKLTAIKAAFVKAFPAIAAKGGVLIAKYKAGVVTFAGG